MANQTYRSPAKTCVKVASTKHYFLHFNKKNGKFFYKGENFTAEEIIARFDGRNDNHAILFSAVAAQYIDWRDAGKTVMGDRTLPVSGGEVTMVTVNGGASISGGEVMATTA